MSRIVDRLEPIPPLDEVTRLRLERAVLGELARTVPTAASARRWPMPALAAAAAVMAMLVLWLAWPSGPGPSSSENRHVADRVERVVSWGDADITVEPGGAVVTAGDARSGVVVVLERGAARFEVAPRRGRPRYVVVADDVVVEVVGTRFRVERTADTARVEVAEGVVVVRRGSVETTLTAGEAWPPAKLADAAAVAAPETATDAGDDAARTAPDEAELELAPTDEAAAGRFVRAPSRRPARPPTVRSPTVRGGGAPRPAARRPAAPVAASSPADRYADAARLEARDAGAAAKIYEVLATRRDAWGATALYALAQLDQNRGRTAAARHHLRTYLVRFPDGANAPDVRAMLARRP